MDINFTDFIFTDIIIHAKASSVQIMTVIIMSDNVVKRLSVIQRAHLKSEMLNMK